MRTVAGMLGGALPFQADDEDSLRELVISGDYALPNAAALSPACVEVIAGLIKVEAEARMSVEQLLVHEWMRGGE